MRYLRADIASGKVVAADLSGRCAMVTVLVRHKVADYNRWRSVFDQSVSFRQKGGERSYRVFRSSEDANDLTLILEWDTLEQAYCFMNSGELRTRMQQAGVKSAPQIHYLYEMHTAHRSAAE